MSERILLVEDNRSLAKLIKLKLEKTLPLDVDVAYTMAEAELFSRRYDYFMAILDLNLPDAPDGEIVDHMLGKKIPSLVITANVDRRFRADILKKPIIDYVVKGGIEDIDYIITTVQRLLANRAHKVMIVDDSMVFRNQMKAMLQNLFFKVFAVAHGEEALNILAENPDIRIVITDYNMPVMNGLELTREIRKTHPKEQLALFVLSSADDPDTSATFLKKGATDFITKPYSKEEFSCRINNAIEALENTEKLTRFAMRDVLTGLYNRRHFTELADAYLSSAAEEEAPCVLALIALHDREAMVSRYGRTAVEAADIYLADLLRSNIRPEDLSARFDDDTCCILFKNTTAENARHTLEHIRRSAEAAALQLEDRTEMPLQIDIGAAFELENNLETMLDEADMKLFEGRRP
jgi:diguanylate cyclase (GGDEF)-like protein